MFKQLEAGQKKRNETNKREKMKESEFQCLPGKMESHGDKNYLSELETWIEVDFIQVNLMSQCQSTCNRWALVGLC